MIFKYIFAAVTAGSLVAIQAQPAYTTTVSSPAIDGTSVLVGNNNSPANGTDDTSTQGQGWPDQSLSPDNESDIRRSDGDRYSWEHDLGSGETATETAFSPSGTQVIVVKSRDRVLRANNITRSTSVYSFSDLGSVVAIIPWRRIGPCFIQNTTLSYQGALDALKVRNGSIIQSSSSISLDGNVAPLSSGESEQFLGQNPGLRRACGQRPIVITKSPGENQQPYFTATETIVVFTLDADVSIIVPERPDSADGFRRGGNRDGPQDPGTKTDTQSKSEPGAKLDPEGSKNTTQV